MTNSSLLFAVVFLCAVGAEGAPQAAPGQCECACPAPAVNSGPPSVFEAGRVTCTCTCKPAPNKPPRSLGPPTAQLTASLEPLVRQGRALVVPDLTVRGPRGSVFFLGASFRSAEPNASWTQWVITKRFAVGPSGVVNWESGFAPSSPDNQLTGASYVARVAIFDDAGTALAVREQTFDVRRINDDGTLAVPPAPAVAGSSAEILQQLAARATSWHVGPSRERPAQMRITTIGEFGEAEMAANLRSSKILSSAGRVLKLQLAANDASPARRVLEAGQALQFPISVLQGCGADHQGPMRAQLDRVGVRLSEWRGGVETLLDCAIGGTVTYSRPQDERLMVTLDVVFSDGSVARQSYSLNTSLCDSPSGCF